MKRWLCWYPILRRGEWWSLTANMKPGKIKSMGVPNVDKFMKEMQLPALLGDQPGTSGPVYLVQLLSYFCVNFFLSSKDIVWLVPMILPTLMLSWGRNFMWLTDIFIDYVPLYNKFRTVSMTLLVATGLVLRLLRYWRWRDIESWAG